MNKNKSDILDAFKSYLDATNRPDGQKPAAAELHRAAGNAVLANIAPQWRECERVRQGHKRAAYLSAEFLIGRAVYNNLLCLGVLDDVKAGFESLGLDFDSLEEVPDAALGNGGLGRLAACYLDSAATRGIALDGYGIRYRYGLFRQTLENGAQKENADDWLKAGDPWSVRREDGAVEVVFNGQTVRAVPYDMPVIGYGAKNIGTLRLWQSEPLSEFDFESYNKGGFDKAYHDANRAREISALLYPDDTLRAGKILRLKQQYFFSNASLQDMSGKYERLCGKDFSRFHELFAIQLNDTHPVIAIPDFIRILMGDYAYSFEEAFVIAKNTFNYTNHTVMPEALETWNASLMRQILPEVYGVIKLINEKLEKELLERGIPRKELYRYRIVCAGKVHMARLASYVCAHINGVSEIHTDILKSEVLSDWQELYPDRVLNVTNGITPRRWLALSNPRLSGFVTEMLGSEEWVSDLTHIKGLRQFADDKTVIERFWHIKQQNKADFARWLSSRHDIVVDERSLFDVQIKRIHEYKRQLLNALGALDLYYGLKDGEIKDFTPTTILFGGKSAPGYVRAKGIIRYIGQIAKLIDADPAMQGLLKVVFVPDYNVSAAEKMIPAAELSEQISTAGTEASGTGNMKLSLNGAPTIGTYDGANIEIFRDCGKENNYLFGAKVNEISKIRDKYDPKKLYENDKRLKRVIDSLVDGTFDDGGTGSFEELYTSILEGASWHKPDHYFLSLDFAAYRNARMKALADYKDTALYARKGFLNTAGSGNFSSDRAVEEYAINIWGIK